MLDKSIQLVIPMAGLGKRFVDAGYKTLKPLIPIHGIPMIKVVVDNLITEQIGHIFLIAQLETIESVNLKEVFSHLDIPLTIVSVESLTQGPADTVLHAKQVINEHLPLVIANSDQFVDADLHSFYSQLTTTNQVGVLLTMEDDDPKWSYVETNKLGYVVNVKEKVVISNQATVGVYGFSKANLSWYAFSAMIEANDRTNGEFYVAPAYNYLLKMGIPVTTINLGPVSTAMYGMGTPEDFEHFISLPVSRRATDAL